MDLSPFVVWIARWRTVDPKVAAAQYVPSPHAHLLTEHPLERVGWGGTRRVCYKIGETGFCVKFYKPPEIYRSATTWRPGIIWEIERRRFDLRRNSSSMEVDVYERFWMRQPDDIRARLPPVVERVFDPKLGWGVLETYYANPDGTAVIPYEFELARQKSPDLRWDIYRQAKALLEQVTVASAPFYEPGNFHALVRPDGGIELKIVDFEPRSKMVLPLEIFWPWYRRLKLRRKTQRYLKRLQRKYGVVERDI